MNDRVALVTGAAGGLGRAIVHRLAKEGFIVVATDIDDDAIRSAAEAAEPSIIWHHMDVTVEEEVRQVFAQVESRFGPCELLVNNAIKPCAIPASFIDTGLEQWRSDYRIIVEGAVTCSRQALRQMVAHGGGAIVNISSVNAQAFYGHPPYSAAKAALLSLTRSVAVQHAAAGIRCNAVVPGTIKTPAWAEQVAANPEVFDTLTQWYPSGDVAEPDQVAEVVAFLGSDKAHAINGATIVADGGLTAGNLAMSRFVEGVTDPLDTDGLDGN